jgi:hypothetical protein
MNVNSIFKRAARPVIAFVAVIGLAVSAAAQPTVLIDFGSETSYRGLSVINPDSNGNYWNSVQPGLLVPDLVDIDNNATTIDLGWDTPVGTDSYNGPAGPTGPEDNKQDLRNNDLPFTDVDAAALGILGGALEGAFDFAAGFDGVSHFPVRFQIQGLNSTSTYDLTFFGSHSFSNDTTTVYSVYTDSTYTTVVDSASLAVQDAVMPWLHNRDQVATIEGVSPQADNILYVEFVGETGFGGYLNALQIVATAAPGVPGDYNDDGKVDAADYVVWRKNVGTMNTLPNDPDGGTIGPNQYITWRDNFGAMNGAGSAGRAAVPEPASMMLVVVAAIGLFSLARWR